MIAELVDPELVGGLMGAVIESSRAEPATPRVRRRRQQDRPKVTRAELAQAVEELERCRARLARSTLHEQGFYIPRDPIASLFQSALEEYLHRHHPEEIRVAQSSRGRRRAGDSPRAVLLGEEVPAIAPPATTRPTKRRKFEVRRPLFLSDPLWVSAKVAEGIRLFTKKHPFNEKPTGPIELHDEARLLLFSDWATGIKRAQRVGLRMEEELGRGARDRREQHVVHLGDVYYSGWGWECEKRFFPYWPVGKSERDIRSWALNGNHEMYSGGHGYFDHVLADERFARQERSSVFWMENRHWRVIGLDTAWDDHALHGDQAEWVANIAAAQPKKKTLLLSHHQLFSAYDKPSKGMAKLAKQLSRPLADGVDAWFWGHEHRCIMYSEHAGVRAARCIGHGGVPEYILRKETDPYKAPAVYEYRKQKPEHGEPWIAFGFAVLDFHEADIHVRYIDEDGNQHQKERIS